jgi:hypothetical protein
MWKQLISENKMLFLERPYSLFLVKLVIFMKNALQKLLNFVLHCDTSVIMKRNSLQNAMCLEHWPSMLILNMSGITLCQENSTYILTHKLTCRQILKHILTLIKYFGPCLTQQKPHPSLKISFTKTMVHGKSIFILCLV